MTCTFMLNGWKHCARTAWRDGLCNVHHPENAKAYERGARTWRFGKTA